MRLFAGLGNPGAAYATNRHNVGFMAVDRIANRYGFSPWKKKGSSLISEGRLGSRKIILTKPQSFMNKSGLPIAEIVRFHKIDPNNVFVFHDELDLAAGKVRSRRRQVAADCANRCQLKRTFLAIVLNPACININLLSKLLRRMRGCASCFSAHPHLYFCAVQAHRHTP